MTVLLRTCCTLRPCPASPRDTGTSRRMSWRSSLHYRGKDTKKRCMGGHGILWRVMWSDLCAVFGVGGDPPTVWLHAIGRTHTRPPHRGYHRCVMGECGLSGLRRWQIFTHTHLFLQLCPWNCSVQNCFCACACAVLGSSKAISAKQFKCHYFKDNRHTK